MQAGHRYEIAFDQDIDRQDVEVGTTWTADQAQGSPIEFMMRVPIIFKADDFGGAMSESAARYIELTNAQDAVASLGVITSAITDNEQINALYRDLDAAGFEAWFHGHTHDWSLPTAEFSGVGLSAQEASFERGIELGRTRLGLEFHTFGAPGNAFDADTARALVGFPQFVVWFFGDAAATRNEGAPDISVLRRILDIETSPGNVDAPSAFLARLDALMANAPAPAVLVLQVHPYEYSDEDLSRLATILEEMEARALFRYTSPFAWWRWEREKQQISIRKTGRALYEIDLTNTELDHEIDLGPARDVPLRVAEKE